MSETKHTPGSWSAGKYAGTDTVFWDRGRGTVPIATVHGLVGLGDPAANARLIAAAPDLLAACEEALRVQLTYARPADDDGYVASNRSTMQLMAAIAKAKESL